MLRKHVQRGFRYLLGFAACAGILITLCVLMAVNRLDDAYAQWSAAEIVIEYMEDHDGNWPKDWQDLQPYFHPDSFRVAGWSFKTFQQHIWIDFSVRSDDLRRQSQASDQPTFKVISSTSVFGSQFGDGPNAMLHRYFKGQSIYPLRDTSARAVPNETARDEVVTQSNRN